MIVDDGRDATTVHALRKAELPSWRDARDERTRAWLDATGFAAAANTFVLLPNADGRTDVVLAGLGDTLSLESVGALPFGLPEGDYRLAEENKRLALGWGLGEYRFDAYRSPKRAPARLLIHRRNQAVLDELAAVTMCRDLINTPACDMLPHHLEAAARGLAERHGATIEVTTGDALLRRGLASIHAVGRASASQPRLIDLRWGSKECPRVTLVGKGVCFDSGGLNLKGAANMRLMKKDMGGAAHVMGLAQLIMTRHLPVALRMLVPAVENAVSANAYRPGDIIRTYSGLTVEIENTDAEGRLILADALALAAEEEPELLIDFATLTGAARTALGTDVAAMFANDDGVAAKITRAAHRSEDPVWRLPLFAPYRRLLHSHVADMVNAPSSPYAGAIAAALFLERFVAERPWVHFDLMAWNVAARPGHPVGGEAMGLRAVFRYLRSRFG